MAARLLAAVAKRIEIEKKKIREIESFLALHHL